ncbi:MAG: hypothetical protein IJ637_08910 [Prevotella sp.]|nr:hypothetical protein [Prevotella sp.]
MMKIFKAISMILLTTVMCTSCLSSSEQTVTLYSDAAITTFTLGTVNRYVHTTTAAGADSVYKTTVAGSAYAFRIDQANRRIYNADSLPVGCDLSHVLCTIGTMNSGTVVVEGTDSAATLTYYSSADSLDLSVPRTFYVYSTDGTAYSKYTISVNVHQENGDEFVWQQTSDSWDPGMDDATVLPAGIKQLIGGCTTEQYALSTDQRLMVSRDGGQTWQEDLLDDDASLLPVRDLSLVSYPLHLSDSTDYVVLVGNRSTDEYPQEQIAMVWRKIVDYGSNAPQGRWTYMERTDGNMHALPRLEQLSIIKYDDGILAFGGAGLGGLQHSPWSAIYQSRDNGITWKTTSRYQMPADFDYSATKVDASVDAYNNIWLKCSGTGQVWRGRLNRLGWDTQE